MISRLDGLDSYKYYFQFTLTGFGNDVEFNVPHKKKYMIPIFQKLSSKIGNEKVIWRYDPIIFTDKYTPEYHLKSFEYIAKELIEQIIGCKIKADKDKNQRKECGCVESIDIGTYNTCKNGCQYCYAN